MNDLLVVGIIAIGVTAAVTGATVLLLVALRRVSVVTQVTIVIASVIVSVVIGMIAAARYMFLSPHDLAIAVSVATISGCATMLAVAAMGVLVARNSRRLTASARSLGDGELVVDQGHHLNAELAALAIELESTSIRLTQARLSERRADAARRDMVAWISHDLRTPLAGIRAMAEALEDSIVDDPREYHRRMREKADQLALMVDDLFELSKIDSGTLTLTLQPISIYDMVSDAVADLKALAGTRRIDVEVEADVEGHLTVIGDARKLSRAIGNLLVNAFQHTPDGASVKIRAAVGKTEAIISVTDTGFGIPESDLALVFEPGWRGTAARTPGAGAGRPSGTAGGGLGLAIVRGIAAAHDGSVSVRNVPGGCRFDLSLPVRPAAGILVS